MNASCVRCDRPGFVTLKIEATLEGTTLVVSKNAKRTALCARCVTELAAWFKLGEQIAHDDLGAIPGGRLENQPISPGGSLW